MPRYTVRMTKHQGEHFFTTSATFEGALAYDEAMDLAKRRASLFMVVVTKEVTTLDSTTIAHWMQGKGGETLCKMCGGRLIVTETVDENEDGETIWSHIDPGCDDPVPEG